MEGPAAAVGELYHRLAGDTRHTGLVKLRDRSSPLRTFPDWSMGWRAIDAAGPQGLLSTEWLGQRLRQADDDEAADILAAFRSFASA